MSKRNRPLSKKQQRGLRDFLDQVEAVRFEAINGKQPKGDEHGIHAEGI